MLRNFFQPRFTESIRGRLMRLGLNRRYSPHSHSIKHWCASPYHLPKKGHNLASKVLQSGSLRFLFLWKHLKVEVCKYRPKNLEELKVAIIEEIIEIPWEMTERDMQSFRLRLSRHQPVSPTKFVICQK